MDICLPRQFNESLIRMLSDCPDILKRIVADKRKELADSSAKFADWRSKALDQAPALNFLDALSSDGLAIIAEIKKASPSAGTIVRDFDPEKIARAYKSGGVEAISVLTDRTYFHGSPDYISLAKKNAPETPILRKDFIISSEQIYEARALGADAFLLIADILDKTELTAFIGLGNSLGMPSLVETRNEKEIDLALTCGAKIIGVNNRNLHDFKVDLSVSQNLASYFPPEIVTVSESGIHNPEDAAKMRNFGFDAILVGESLMRSGLNACQQLIKEFKTA